MTFTPFMGNALTRMMIGDHFFIRTLYESNVGTRFSAYTNEGGDLDYAGGKEMLYSSDGLNVNREYRKGWTYHTGSRTLHSFFGDAFFHCHCL